MNKFWVVWNPAGHSPTFKHGTLESAEDEATRLASTTPLGNRYYILEAVAIHEREAPPIRRTVLSQLSLPAIDAESSSGKSSTMRQWDELRDRDRDSPPVNHSQI